MRRLIITLITFAIVLSWSLAASAHHEWGDRDQPYERGGYWEHHSSGYHHERDSLPFGWHDHYRTFEGRHHLERIYDREMGRRFPGLQAYRWYGDGQYHRGFWHHGHFIKDAILFFDRDGELVSFGYMTDGVFVYARYDDEVYRNHDSFFVSWWNRH